VRPFILIMAAKTLCYDGEYNYLLAEGWLPPAQVRKRVNQRR
jgi:hypothetical protein